MNFNICSCNYNFVSCKFECSLPVFPDDGFDTRKLGHYVINKNNNVHENTCSNFVPCLGIHKCSSLQHVNISSQCISMGFEWFDGGLGISTKIAVFP